MISTNPIMKSLSERVSIVSSMIEFNRQKFVQIPKKIDCPLFSQIFNSIIRTMQLEN